MTTIAIDIFKGMRPARSSIRAIPTRRMMSMTILIICMTAVERLLSSNASLAPAIHLLISMLSQSTPAYSRKLLRELTSKMQNAEMVTKSTIIMASNHLARVEVPIGKVSEEGRTELHEMCSQFDWEK